MSTTFERTSSGIIYKPAEDRQFPQIDLLTLLFESDLCAAEEDTVLHADAADPSRCITKAQLRVLVQKTARTLRDQYGIGLNGPDQDVALAICTGHWLLPTLFYATVAADCIYSASSPASTPKELVTQLTQVSAKLLFCTEDTKPTALAAAKLAGLPLSRDLCLGPTTSHTFQLTTSNNATAAPIPLSPTPLPWKRHTSPTTLANQTISLLFSSGTTGPPKAVRLSHTNMVAQATLVIDANRAYYTRRGLPQPNHRTVAHLPPAHIAGLQGYFVNPFYAGGTVYWMERFDFSKFLEYARRHRVTNFFSVPPVYLAIAKSPAVTDQFRWVVQAISGAAPMGRELQAAARRKLGGGKAQLSQTWGLSETTGSMTFLPMGQDGEAVNGSVSSLLGGTKARIVDDEGRDVEPGQEGEIWVQGPQVTKGYFENEEANREAFVDGWFRTGDVAVFRDGVFWVVDRKKELIEYKGTQVAPAELEALLISHPKILDAAVIGMQAKETEVPRAYVVADRKQISSDEIVAWVAGQVASHKRLRGGVVFLEAIPKSPSGKILRKDLRALAQKSVPGSKL